MDELKGCVLLTLSNVSKSSSRKFVLKGVFLDSWSVACGVKEKGRDAEERKPKEQYSHELQDLEVRWDTHS